MNKIDFTPIKVPLIKEAHHLARRFAAEQTNGAKAEQVYLNTLAVYAVRSYLQWLQIDSELTGDSWQASMRSLFDVADLVIPQMGKIECRPLRPGEEIMQLSPDRATNCRGYVAVGLDRSLSEAQLWGFVKTTDLAPETSEVLISEMGSLEDLLDYISWFESVGELLESPDRTAKEFREFLGTRSSSDFAVQLEQIIKIPNEGKQLREIVKYMSVKEPVASGDRELLTKEDNVCSEGLDEEDIFELADRLLSRVNEIIG